MRTGPLSYAVVVAAVLVAAPALADNAGFVSTNGAHFELNGLPYYYAGANFWQGMNLGMADASGGDRARLGSELDRLQAAGVTNVRIMAGSEGPNTAPYRMVPALQTAPGSYDPNVFAGLDYLMAELNSRNMRAVMCLNNFWHWSGGMAQYVSWAEGGSAIPYPPSYPDWTGNWETFHTYSAKFYTDATAQDAFKDHINTLLNRTNTVTGVQYKNDPTVFSWELANEPRRYGTTTWVDDTAAYIKSLDANHMVTVGSEGATPWGTKADFVTTHDGAAIDYATCHIWPQNWGWYDPANPTSGSKKYANAESAALAYLQDHLGWSATDLVKPLVLEEFGLARDGGSFDPSEATTYRDQFYAALFAAVLADALADGAAAGDNFWAWGGEGRPSYPAPQWIGDPPHETPGWYSVYDLDANTLLLIASHAAEMQSLIPEPATLGLLGVGAGLILRRRRRHA